MIEAVTFTNRREQILSGVLHPPSARSSSSGVILCHGMESNKESEKIVALAEMASDKGLWALRFDFACADEKIAKFEEITYTGELEDLRAAFEFLYRNSVRKIGIFGSSMGGAVGVLFAAGETRIASLITLAAPLHPEKITERLLTPHEVEQWRDAGFVTYHGRRLNVTLLDDLQAIDIPWAATQVRCPTLVIHGDRDETVPVEEAQELFSWLGGTKKLAIIQGADHRFSTKEHLQNVLAGAMDWMTTYLL
jgi:alpha/beta superfamily hydrolase